MPDSNSPKNDLVQEKRQQYQPIATHVSDTSEGGLETIIFEDMLARGWIAGDRHDYDRQSCVDFDKAGIVS